MRLRHVVMGLVAVSGFGCRSAPVEGVERPPDPAVTQAGHNPTTASLAVARQIDPDAIEGDVRTISDDRFAGRGPGTQGDVDARRWLAQQLEAAGYAPGLPNATWEQPFDIVGVTATPTDEVTDAWRFDGMAEDAALAFLVGVSVANADQMPRWNPGDEFAAIRAESN